MDDMDTMEAMDRKSHVATSSFTVRGHGEGHGELMEDDVYREWKARKLALSELAAPAREAAADARHVERKTRERLENRPTGWLLACVSSPLEPRMLSLCAAAASVW